MIRLSSVPIRFREMKKRYPSVINELSAKGANVIFQDAHVSGHACQEELKLIYSLVKPKYAIPVHGEYRHLKAQAGIARSSWHSEGEHLHPASPVMYSRLDDE